MLNVRRPVTIVCALAAMSILGPGAGAQSNQKFEKVLIEAPKPYTKLVSDIAALGGKVTKQYQHIIILFTDGLNTLNRWSGTGQNGTGAQVDARMKMLCSNIKATGVTIFTVQIDTSGTDGVSPVLPACATDASHFFMLTSASQIASAFQQIGVEITKLRVAR